jgi:dihydrolipoamide dehydrogenase
MAGKKPIHTQLAVIGAGPGGYTAAFLAADQGMAVTLIDPDPNPGGVCLHRGCIPSKALLHVAKLIEEARAAEQHGVSFGKPVIDLARLRSFKEEVVAKLTGGLGQLTRARKIRYLQGHATFTGSTGLAVEMVAGSRETVVFQDAILATGSRPVILPFLPDSDRVLDSTSALKLDKVPKRLLVIGGGYIGLELGSVYAALGSQVTVVEMLDSLLAGADPDLVRPLAKKLNTRFHKILLSTRVAAVKEKTNGLQVTFEGADAPTRAVTYDAVLASVGRRPNSENLGLEKTGVRLDKQGFVQVNESMATDEPTIRAIGDLVGQPMLAHKASHESKVAVESIAGEKVAFEPLAIPAVVFTDPEIAWCGLTETGAREANRQVTVTRFPWAASGRAMTLGRDDGLTKLILEPETGRVLGVGITGPGAGELIAEAVLAVEMGAVAADLELTIHPHPTLSETIMEAAELFFQRSTHIYKPKKGRK